MQPLSHADGNRLNLEYNDAIIDYILNEIRKPGLSDEVVDLKKLGIRKHKNVNFSSVPSIIPSVSISSNSYENSERSGEEGSAKGDTSNVLPVPNDHCNSPSPTAEETLKSEDQVVENGVSDDVESEPKEEGAETTKQMGRGRQGTIVGQKQQGTSEEVDKANQKNKSRLTFFDSTLEMSKILLDHIPLEVLRRLVMRWPVDEEDTTVEQDIANRRRLLISLWDCSGDPIQLSITPLLFSHRCIFLMTYNATRDLQQPAESFMTHKLNSLSGTVPLNGEVLEEWIASVTAHSMNLLTGFSSRTHTSPQLPPLIFVTTHGDSENPRPIPFDMFFSRDSYSNYKSHLLDEKPSVIVVSNLYETEFEGYRGHHFLRREIEYMARQMPYIYDMIPVQWVRFEQLLFAILEQNKVVIFLNDLERYISEMCDISGPLQVQPVLAHFNDIGSIIHFHRHPALMKFVVIKPQWLMDAMSSIFTSTTNKWSTNQVRTSFQNLLFEGSIQLDVLLLAYRCSRLPQKYWNEMLYFMNYMDLIACHPSLHQSKAVYIPCMVSQSPPGFLYGPTPNDPSTIFFTTSANIFPLSLYNQLVVHCIRSSLYPPTIYHEIVHLRLNSSHHMILRREKNRLGVLVQSDTQSVCHDCPPGKEGFQIQYSCMGVSHMVDSEENFIHCDTDFLPCQTTLDFKDDDSIPTICSRVREFLLEHLDFLTKCWYPGLVLECRDELSNALNSKWETKVLQKGLASGRLAVWFGVS